MNIFKKIFSLVLLVGLFFSCEKDDVCTARMTPKLVIRFYDVSNTDEIKSVKNLSVIVLPGNDTLINREEKDSIAIPLNVNKNHCKFILVKKSNRDTILFSYSTENIFVSKACGYKSIFKNFQNSVQQDNQNWIDHTETLIHKISIDTTAHVKIFH